MAALASLKIAKGQPRSEALTKMESTPVWGVLIKKPTTAPLLAPPDFRLIPTGMTPQEQSGSGTPSTTARRTPCEPERQRFKKSAGNKTCNTPATRAPSNNHVARSSKTFQLETKMGIIRLL